MRPAPSVAQCRKPSRCFGAWQAPLRDAAGPSGAKQPTPADAFLFALPAFPQEVCVHRSASGNACLDFVVLSLLRSERRAGLTEVGRGRGWRLRMVPKVRFGAQPASPKLTW